MVKIYKKRSKASQKIDQEHVINTNLVVITCIFTRNDSVNY